MLQDIPLLTTSKVAITTFWTPEVKKHLQKDLCIFYILWPYGTHGTVMTRGCGPSNPEQARPGQGRHKFVHTSWIPYLLLLSNIDIAYRVYHLVLKLSPWISAALIILRFFLYPVRKPFLFSPFHYFFQTEMLSIYRLVFFYSKPLTSMTLIDHVFLNSFLSFCLIRLQCRSLVSNEFYR